MDVEKAINTRRSIRSIEKIEVSKVLLNDIFSFVQLAPSCFNNQPWRYIAIYDKEKLKEVFSTFSTGNEWAFNSSLVIAVCSMKESDCVIKGREYFLFDTGISVGFLLLRATELGLIAHPIAGFDEIKAKKILNIPENFILISFIIVGKKADKMNPILTEKQKELELKRPDRYPLKDILFLNKYGQSFE